MKEVRGKPMVAEDREEPEPEPEAEAPVRGLMARRGEA